MEKHKENLFLKKFSLLNSQEHSEEIHWSSSCSSEYEFKSLHDKSINQQRTRVMKRKRKKKVHKNIANLNITISNTSRETRNLFYQEKSPVLGCIGHRKSTSTSPILQPSKSFCNGNTITSPILTSKTAHSKSPILIPKTASLKSAVKVRKKLFNVGNFSDHEMDNENHDKKIEKEVLTDIVIKEEPEDSEIILGPSEEIDENLMLNGNASNAKLEFVKRVRSFFDSNFSSQNTSITSQNSISEIATPKNSSETSEEIDILSCKSQVILNKRAELIQERRISTNSSENSYDFDKHSKKIRYKKDGHAYRLNRLLKKQKASLSLWQHERYLAANSNFVIPKGEFSVFRIQKVNFKYGCYLIECVNGDDEKLLISINSCYVLENIVCESVIKLYEPFKILQYNHSKIIINVTKFECSTMKI